MKKTILVLAILTSTLAWASDDKKEGETEVQEETKESVEESPKVENYIVGILKAGPNMEIDSLEKAEMLESHVEYLKRLNERGKLYASGPLSTNPEMRGLYIFNVRSIESAAALMQQDAAIREGLVTVEYHVWKTRDYPSVALMGEDAEEEDGLAPRSIHGILLVIFTLIILVLMFRTFRGKASV